MPVVAPERVPVPDLLAGIRDRAALDEGDVQIPVAIRVEQGDSRTHRFREMLRLAEARLVMEAQTRRLRDLREPQARTRIHEDALRLASAGPSRARGVGRARALWGPCAGRRPHAARRPCTGKEGPREDETGDNREAGDPRRTRHAGTWPQGGPAPGEASRCPCSARTTVWIPPRIRKSPSTTIHRGFTASVRSSRMRFTAVSWNDPSSRKDQR